MGKVTNLFWCTWFGSKFVNRKLGRKGNRISENEYKMVRYPK